MVSLRDNPEVELPGVIMDINPHGMLIRLMETIPVGQRILIQMMRDDTYQRKLSTPHKGETRRVEGTPDGFFDHGVKLEVENIRKSNERPVHIPNRNSRPQRATHPSRMHTVDMTLDAAKRKRNR